jgi:small subunit ribosomal protein S17
MAKQKNETKIEIKQNITGKCTDVKCPFHGNLKLRGRKFQGTVVSKFPKRLAIEFERTVFIQKYERYAKSKTKLHARLPDCLANEIQVGDYIEIQECRQLSKIIAFVVIKKIRSANENKIKSSEEIK